MSARNGAGLRERTAVPVSSVPPPTPTANARGSAARADSLLSLTAPATPDGARTVGSRPDDSHGDSRPSQRKAGESAAQTGSTSDAPATAKQADATPSTHAGAGNASAAPTPTSSFGQTLSATLSATATAPPPTPPPSAPAGSAGALRASTPESASSTTANSKDAATRTAGADRRLSSGATSDAEEPSPLESSDDDALEAASQRLPAAALAGSAHGADVTAADNARSTAGPTATAVPTAAAPPPASTSPAASLPVSEAPNSAAAPVDLTSGAAATPTQLLAQLNQALGAPSAAGKAPAARSAGEAVDAPGMQAAVTASSVDATAQPGESSSTPSAPAETQSLHSPVGSGAWSDELGSRLTLMAQQGIATASLRLSPAHLGPLEVHIAVRDNNATVWFGSLQSDTRAALEQALPRLRELFASQGLHLTNAGVSGETPRGARQQSQAAPALLADSAREVNAIAVTSVPGAHQGLIDTYA